MLFLIVWVCANGKPIAFNPFVSGQNTYNPEAKARTCARALNQNKSAILQIVGWDLQKYKGLVPGWDLLQALRVQI